MIYEWSEGNARRNIGGTAGPLATVTSTESGLWSDEASVGDTVRLHTQHTVEAGNTVLGETVISPSAASGGTASDEVGDVVALATGRSVDLAARSVDTPKRLYDIDGVVSRDARDYIGETVTKYGAMSGEEQATVLATGCDTVVTLHDNTKYSRFSDIVLLSCEASASDSGGPVLFGGELFGMTIAGTDGLTLVQYAPNIESALGVDVAQAYEPKDLSTKQH